MSTRRPKRSKHGPSGSSSSGFAEGTRTLLFSDAHANLAALSATLTKAREIGVDSYLFLGDAVGYGPSPREVIAILAELPSAIVLQGNHDYAVANDDTGGMNQLAVTSTQWTREQLSKHEKRWLMTLPVEHEADDWMAVHGSPVDPEKFNLYVQEISYRDNLAAVQIMGKFACFFGHTHFPAVYRAIEGLDEAIYRPVRAHVGEGSIHLVNPGSVGQPRDGNPSASFAVWDRLTDEIAYHRVHYDVEETIRALKRADLPMDLSYRLTLGR